MSPAAAEFASACSALGPVPGGAVVVAWVVGEAVAPVVVTPVVAGVAAVCPPEPQPVARTAASSAEATAASGWVRTSPVTRFRILVPPRIDTGDARLRYEAKVNWR
jgi:hypothetical protein